METKRKQIAVSLILFFLSIILSHTYRPYIYKNHFFDFHFADTIGNIFAVPTALFFLCGINKSKTKINSSIPIIIVAFILYEFLALLKLHGVFDIFDIIATVISGTITYVILIFIFNIKEL